MKGQETRGFQSEVKQLLHLMIHSLYSNKEIFLRELISNASDAADKLRFRALSNPDLYQGDGELRVRISVDRDNRTLTLSDNGIGMTREEVIENLGTIAKSGTKAFLESLGSDQAKDSQLIGQFGVGFYSAFIVADKVTVRTRAAGASADQGVFWESTGEGDYTIADIEKADRGTEITLHLREGEEDFLDDWRLRNIIGKYSDHIALPVEILSSEGEEGEKKWEKINKAQALWTCNKADISDEEYQEFYKHIAHDFSDPLIWSHNRVEGKQEYTSLLYIPAKAPWDLFNRDHKHGLKLYVQRVFIMDDADQFLPLYLRFVKGVVDSSDLPLNVSREVLQQDERVASIRSALTKRVLTTLDGMAKKEAEDYQAFWDEFGEVIKEGAGDEFANRELYSGLLRFASTTGEDATKNVGLKDYVERFVEGQERIYYLVADSFENARSSPHLEIFRERGIEVLLLFDRIDEWLMSNLPEFDGKAFQDITRAGLVLPGEAADKTADDEDSNEDADKEDADDDPLAERIKTALGDRVEAVRASTRLTDSPACLVQGEFALGRQMQRIMEATGQAFTPPKPSFEYNAKHPLLKRLDQESDEDRFAELVLVLFDQASLAEGDALQDAAAYVNRMNRLLLELLER